MRLIPQVLRQYLVINTIRNMPIDVMMNNCGSSPALTHLKRIMLHDKEKTKECILATIDQLANKTFKFLYKNRREMGRANHLITWEEDLAGASYTNMELITVCRNLIDWIDKQPEYKFIAEINGARNPYGE